jgi:integrase
MENDIIKKDYSQFVKIHQTEKKDISNKYFTEAEIKKLLANQDYTAVVTHGKGKGTTRVEMQLVDSVIILLYTGVRIGELLSLKCSDVDIENRTIYVPGTKTEAADRKVPIHKDVIPYIKKRMAEGNEYLITNANGKDIKSTQYRAYFFEPFMKHINAGHTPHATRHTFISIMDNCGVPAESVVLKRIVGHKNKTVTEHYTHKDIAQLLAAIDKFKLLQ